MPVFSRFSSSPLNAQDAQRRRAGMQSLARDRINPDAATTPKGKAYASLASEAAAAPGTAQASSLAPTARASAAPPSSGPVGFNAAYTAPTPDYASQPGGHDYLERQAPAATPNYAALPGGHENLELGGHVPGTGGAPPGAAGPSTSTNPFDLSVVRGQQADALKAAENSYTSGAAKAQADAEARAGLGGFGLSGAANALVRDTSLQSADQRAKGIAALQAQQRQELRDTAIDFANLKDLADNGVDLTGIDPSLAPSPDAAKDNAREDLGLTNNGGVDVSTLVGGLDTGDAPPGSKERPIDVRNKTLEAVQAVVGPLKPVGYQPVGGGTLQEYEDAQGQRYFFGVRGVGGTITNTQ